MLIFKAIAIAVCAYLILLSAHNAIMLLLLSNQKLNIIYSDLPTSEKEDKLMDIAPQIERVVKMSKKTDIVGAICFGILFLILV